MLKRKVLFLSHLSGLSGAERSLLDLLTGLDRSRFEPLVILPKDGPLRRKLLSINCKTMVFDIPWWMACRERSRSHFQGFLLSLPSRARYLRDLIKRESVRLVYTNTAMCIDGAVSARLAGVPHVWHIHEIISINNEIKAYIPKFTLPVIAGILSDRVIVPSNAARRDIEWYLSRKKIRLIYNGVEADRFSDENPDLHGKKLREELGIGEGTKILGFVGTFTETKGQLDLVESARTICADDRDIVFLFVGEGNRSYKNVVKKRVSYLRLEDKVRFMDFRDDIENVMRGIDVLVSASWVESFSRVICEAMAAGKPVVATKCGGPEEIVVNGETGYVVPPRNPKEMSRAIIRLIESQDVATEMGRKGRDRVKNLFGIGQYVRSIEAVLEEMIR